MAPGRPSSRLRTGGFAARGEGTPQVRFGNQNGKRRTWRPNHQQAFLGSVREGFCISEKTEDPAKLQEIAVEGKEGTSITGIPVRRSLPRASETPVSS